MKRGWLPAMADTLILKDVSALSNLPGPSDVPGRNVLGAPAAEAEYRPALPQEVDDALSLILGSGAAPAALEQVREFEEFARMRGIDLANTWVAGADGRLAWALLPILSPGKTMMLLMPACRPESIDVGRLIEAICEHFASRGVYLAQALLDPADAPGRELFARRRFREMAELLYLQASIRRTSRPPALPTGFAWLNYSEDSHALFTRAIQDSYCDTLDCPGLNGLREIEDVVAGHKASGEFDPRFWFVLLERDLPHGVLLLNKVPRSESAELVYVGLAPAARGRGIGQLLMRQAQWAVKQMQLASIALAVDSRNQPALSLYYRNGFQRVGCRIALMRDLRESA